MTEDHDGKGNDMNTYFTKLDSGKWGVTVRGDLDGLAAKMAGREVTVTKRNGQQSTVRLGRRITSWNAGRAATYAIDRDGPGEGWERAPVAEPAYTPPPVNRTTTCLACGSTSTDDATRVFCDTCAAEGEAEYDFAVYSEDYVAMPELRLVKPESRDRYRNLLTKRQAFNRMNSYLRSGTVVRCHDIEGKPFIHPSTSIDRRVTA